MRRLDTKCHYLLLLFGVFIFILLLWFTTKHFFEVGVGVDDKSLLKNLLSKEEASLFALKRYYSLSMSDDSKKMGEILIKQKIQDIENLKKILNSHKMNK